MISNLFYQKTRQIQTVLVALMISASFVSCNKDKAIESKDQSITPLKGIVVGFRASAKLHRGEKWSNRHGVTPCTEKFGICDIKFGPYIDYFSIDFSEPFNDGGTDKIAIILNESVPQSNEIFMTSEENPFHLLDTISNVFGYNNINILPDNYTLITNNAYYPYGYLICDVDLN